MKNRFTDFAQKQFIHGIVWVSKLVVVMVLRLGNMGKVGESRWGSFVGLIRVHLNQIVILVCGMRSSRIWQDNALFEWY